MNTEVQDAKVRDAEAPNTEAPDLCMGTKDKSFIKYGLKFLTFK